MKWKPPAPRISSGAGEIKDLLGTSTLIEVKARWELSFLRLSLAVLGGLLIFVLEIGCRVARIGPELNG